MEGTPGDGAGRFVRKGDGQIPAVLVWAERERGGQGEICLCMGPAGVGIISDKGGTGARADEGDEAAMEGLAEFYDQALHGTGERAAEGEVD